jgi:hypothetical protein
VARTFHGGSSEALDFGTPASLKFSFPFSIACWAYFNADGATQGLVSYSNGGYYFRRSIDNKLHLLKSNVSDDAHSTSTISGGVYHHLAVTVDGSGNVAFYTDGVANGTGTTASDYSSPSGHLYFGRDVANEYLSAALSQVGIWDVGLSAGEVAALASGKLPFRIRPSKLQLWVPVTGLFSPEPDYSGNKINGTLAGAPTATTEAHVDIPWYETFEQQPAQFGVVVFSQPVQEIYGGPPIRGAPFTQHLPIAPLPQTNPLPPPPPPPPPSAASQVVAPEIYEGPKVIGAPWAFPPTTPTLPEAHGPLARLQNGPVMPETFQGPPMRGSPFRMGFIEVTEGSNLVIPPSPPVRLTRKLPFLSREPMLNDPNRWARFSEKLSNMVNAMISRGQIVQVSPSDWRINPPHTDTGPPTALSDSSSGHFQGQFWYVSGTGSVYVCFVDTPGAAVWIQIK